MRATCKIGFAALAIAFVVAGVVRGTANAEETSYAVIRASKSVLLSNPEHENYIITDVRINSAVPERIAASYERNFFVSLLDYNSKNLFLLPGSFSNWLSAGTLVVYCGQEKCTFAIYNFDPVAKTLILSQRLTIPGAVPFTATLPEGKSFIFQTKNSEGGYTLCRINTETKMKENLFDSDRMIHDFRVVNNGKSILCILQTDDSSTTFLRLEIADHYSTTTMLHVPNVAFPPVYGSDNIYLVSTLDKKSDLYKVDLRAQSIVVAPISSNVWQGTMVCEAKNEIYVSKTIGVRTQIAKILNSTGAENIIADSPNAFHPRYFSALHTLLYFTSASDVASEPRLLSKTTDTLYELRDGESPKLLTFSSVIWLPQEGGKLE
jgi:dipeptidyl aminopeptidase/acylaminoacyl peptidase